MTPEATRLWMQERFDRLEDQVDKQAEDLRSDLIRTRHGQREIMEQIALQVVVVQEAVNAHTREIGDLRKNERVAEGWRNRMIGSIGVLMFLFPATVAVILKYG